MTEPGTGDVIQAIAEWSTSHGIDNIKDRQEPGKAFSMGEIEHDGSKWAIWVNASSEPVLETERFAALPPWTFYIEFNGWPAGFVNAGGGTIAAGEAANIHTFLAALEANKVVQ